MKYSKSFETIVSNCLNDNSYVGLGNPLAKILFVGKEAAISESDLINHGYNHNAKNWAEHIKNGTSEVHTFIPVEKSLRMEGHTWRKYQKFFDYIYQNPKRIEAEKYQFNFLENVFTTEASDAPAKETSTAKKKNAFKEKLQIRKATFFKEAFIQDFPIVILACSDYFVNYEQVREIDSIFGVTYDTVYELSPKQRFWTHYNPNKTKLVIHCRQLSTDTSNALLEKMGEVVREHLMKLGLI